MLCQHLPAIGADLCARLGAMVLRSRSWLFLQRGATNDTESLSRIDLCPTIRASWALRRFRDRDRLRLWLWLWNWFRDRFRFRYWLWNGFWDRFRRRGCMFNLRSTIYAERLIRLYRRAAVAAHLSALRRFRRRGWSRMFDLGSTHITEHGVLRDLRMAVGAEDHAFYPLDLPRRSAICVSSSSSLAMIPDSSGSASSPLSFSFL